MIHCLVSIVTEKQIRDFNTCKISAVQDIYMGLRLCPFYDNYVPSFNLQVKYQTKSIFSRK